MGNSKRLSKEQREVLKSQPFEHGNARIVSNKAGLYELALTLLSLTSAKTEGKAKTPREVFASDGEGYVVEVVRLPDDGNDKAWEGFPPHYCDRGYLDDLHKEGEAP